MLSKFASGRTASVILVCGCLISLLGFGPRSAFGLFLSPMSGANGWGRDVFALARAIQMLMLSILLGLLSAVINLPIVEKPVARAPAGLAPAVGAAAVVSPR